MQGNLSPTGGEIIIPAGVFIGYVPQLPAEGESYSGGQLFNKNLSAALACQPDILCLDEPTNHLDRKNRRSLMQMLDRYAGTLFVVSHDVELLQRCIDTIWHIENGEITVFEGNYDDFLHHRSHEQEKLKSYIRALEKNHAKAQEELRLVHERSARRARANVRENDRKLLGYLKASADASLGKQHAKMSKIKDALSRERQAIFEAEEIKVQFELAATHIERMPHNIIDVKEGRVGYGDKEVLSGLSFSIDKGERVALVGENGSGKSTLLKAFLQNPLVSKTGEWHLPKSEWVGYLDQAYKTLPEEKTVLETLQALSKWNDKELRRFLNDFLFRKNEEVYALVSTLSGGERVRLVLACIALRQPPILLLDEITNNIDLKTRQHVIEVLKNYPRTLFVISHDSDFLTHIGIQTCLLVKNGKALLRPFSPDSELDY